MKATSDLQFAGCAGFLSAGHTNLLVEVSFKKLGKSITAS